MSRRCDHDVKPGRKEGTERCTKCSWVFPCRDNDCAHGDCLDFRAELPRCHFCRKRVQGSPAGFRMPGSPVPELRDFGGQDASWTAWSVRGVTRAVHYTCRDAVDRGDEVVQDSSEQVHQDQEAIA